jgi:hypothetical protein
MYDIIQAAGIRLAELEKTAAEREAIARQIMENIKAMNITLNDDDWYIFDTTTKELLFHFGSKITGWTVRAGLAPGQTALRGLAIKMRGIELWRDVK